MIEVVVLSPHRDDAVFSLGMALSRWRSLPVRIVVVNYFTVSGYAPQTLTREAISEQRQREDRRALHMIDPRIRIQSADRVDAPLRLDIPAFSVCDVEAAAVRQSEVDLLSRDIARLSRKAVVIAPLGLGNHVDHLTVNRAALQAVPGNRLSFYEDLPYAAWTSEAAIADRIRQTVQGTGIELKPKILRKGCNMRLKRRLVSQYRTQITASEGAAIAAFAAKYRVGERIWIPRRSSSWNSL